MDKKKYAPLYLEINDNKAWSVNLGRIYIHNKKKSGIYGKITDKKTHRPVNGAKIIFKQKTEKVFYSDNKGRFNITAENEGKFTIFVIKDGYKKIKKTGKIKSKQVLKIDFELQPIKGYKPSKIDKDAIFRLETIDEYNNKGKGKGKIISEDRDDDDEASIVPDEELEAPRSRGRKEELEKIKKILGGGRESRDKFTVSGMLVEKSGKTHAKGKSAYSPVIKPSGKSGLRASYVDDNKQFNYFLDYLKKYKYLKHYEVDISNRFIINCIDSKGNTLPDTKIEIYSVSPDSLLEKGLTYSDGTYLFFASMYPKKTNFLLKAYYKDKVVKKRFSIQDKRHIKVKFNMTKSELNDIPLDLLFIFDTTGSMGEEIDRLKRTIEIINLNLLSFKPKPNIRFGMVLYKDIKDVYITKTIPFTNDFDNFTNQLKKQVFSGGGGDGPEDLQRALKVAMKEIKWRKKGIKTAFIITDAEPHLYEDEKDYTYIDAAIEAKSKGIKLYSIGCGGLNPMGEYVLRQLSQFTYAKYIFLTYGEKGESEGGKPGSVSHHTGENFNTSNLEAILINILKDELKKYSGKMIETDEYFEANPVKDEESKETLEKLFIKAITQLYDYSSVKIEKDTPTAIAPISDESKKNKATAEYFYENLQFALVKSKKFKAVERKDLQPILDELKFQLDELSDESKAAELGKFVGAKLLITAKMYEKGDFYELYLKLMNVETVEILSVTKVRINKKLGL